MSNDEIVAMCLLAWIRGDTPDVFSEEAHQAIEERLQIMAERALEWDRQRNERDETVSD